MRVPLDQFAILLSGPAIGISLREALAHQAFAFTAASGHDCRWQRNAQRSADHNTTVAGAARVKSSTLDQILVFPAPAPRRLDRMMPSRTLLYLADRIGTRLRAKARSGRTVTVRVRFANLNFASRSITLDAPMSTTVILAELAEDLVRAVLADHPDERTISLLAICVSHLEEDWDLQLDFPLGLHDEPRRPGSKIGMARRAADRAVDKIRDRFGSDAIGYGSVALGISRSVPDEFRELAEKGRVPGSGVAD